jgi:hypothetical protein
MRPVHFEKQGNLGVVTIDNPPINLADNPLFAAFTEVLDEVDSSDVRALLIQAEGDHFGGGVNVNTTFVGVDSKNARRLLNRGIPMVTRLEGLNIPVVCAVRHPTKVDIIRTRGRRWRRRPPAESQDSFSTLPLSGQSVDNERTGEAPRVAVSRRQDRSDFQKELGALMVQLSMEPLSRLIRE